MRKRKRILLSLLLIVGLMGILAGCKKDSGNSENSENEKVIRLGIQSGVAISEVCQQTGILESYLEEKGIALEYVEFTYGPPMIESLSADQIDVAFIGNLPVFTGVSNGTDLKVIYLTLLSENGINGVVAAPDSGIENIKDLKGKNVGVPIGSAAHFGLELLLNKEGMTLEDIQVVNIAAADMASSLANGEIDAGALWETTLTKAKLRSGGKTIATSKDVMEDQTFAVATESFLEEHGEYAEYFLAGLIQVENYMVENPEESVAGIVERTGDDEAAWEYVYGMTQAEGFTDETFETAGLAKEFLKENDLLQEDYDYEAIFDQSYWDRAKELLGQD